MIDPLDPAPLCAACEHHLHGACMGWWDFCRCTCGLTPDDPRTSPNGRHQGEP